MQSRTHVYMSLSGMAPLVAEKRPVKPKPTGKREQSKAETWAQIQVDTGYISAPPSCVTSDQSHRFSGLWFPLLQSEICTHLPCIFLILLFL